MVAADRRLTSDLYVGPNDHNMLGYADTRLNETVANCTGGDDPLPPANDRAARPLFPWAAFGSAHPAGLPVAMADGSVRTFSYAVQPAVWVAACVRNDGRAVGPD